jgi:tetratricopeptide (TPR) repeat protein
MTDGNSQNVSTLMPLLRATSDPRLVILLDTALPSLTLSNSRDEAMVSMAGVGAWLGDIAHFRCEWRWRRVSRCDFREQFVRRMALLCLLMTFGAIAPSAEAAPADDLSACKSGRGDAAIEACTRAIASGKFKDSEVGAAYNNRALLLTAKGEHDQAIASYNEAVRLIPNDAIILSNRATARYRKGDHDRAIADFDRSLALKPRDNVTFRGRGNAWFRKGDYDRAAADFGAAISIDPKDAVAYNNRAYAFERKGDLARAVADFTEALRLDSKSTPSLFGRGRALELKGDFARALDDHRAALTLDPNDQFVREAVRRLEKKLAPAAGAKPLPVPPVVAPDASSPAQLERRVALVIGNSRYAHVPALPNPGNDAAALAATLRRIGFAKVTLLTDLTRDSLIEALKALSTDATTADWAVVYFAGHGIELGGINFLLPIDAKLTSDRDAGREAIRLEQVLDAVAGARKLGVVIFDACRDNPFVNTILRTMGSTRSGGQGLAPVDPEGATFLAYAAKHGQTALDGAGTNSPFMAAVLKQLEGPAVELSLMFRRVRDEVMRVTQRKQEPFTYASLPAEEFYFRKP